MDTTAQPCTSLWRFSVPTDNYLGHPPELIAQAAVLPHGHFVQLDDMLFQQHDLGPRYAQILTNDYRQHRSLSYAYLNLPGTNYDLITKPDNPVDLGSLQDLMSDRQLVEQLVKIFRQPTPQQLALALIKAKKEGLQDGDELGTRRLVKWALTYERRAHWIATNRKIAFAKEFIDWSKIQ